MARPREFDTREALDAAIEVFRTKGYEGSSLAELLDAMGIQKGSMYKVWPSKHELFVAALRQYLEREEDALAGAVLAPPREALEQVVAHVVAQCAPRDGTCGCMAVNAAVELGPSDAEVKRILDTHARATVRSLTALIERGQRAGDFRGDRDARLLAEFVHTSLLGLLCESRRLTSTRRLRAIGELVLQVLEAA